MPTQVSTNYVAAVIYDALRSEALMAEVQRSGNRHRGCLTRMDLIWECRSTEVHDLFRRVADRVLTEVLRERPELVRKSDLPLHVVFGEGRNDGKSVE